MAEWRFKALFAAALLLVLGLGVEGKIQLTKQPRLAILFAGPEFTGNYFSVDGFFASCYNVLKEGGVGSITLEPGTDHCEVWGVAGCGDGGDGKDKPKTVFQDAPTLVWNRRARTKNEVKRDVGAVKSIRCFEKVTVEGKIKLQ
ncbi:hypothetical protein F5882DRAFT_413626 [Hyaloscypha sp. PMI_1271]|nr:hypothetical protein F5882DRAFT_413626 [Hyaloscypha sp. PMI_1271]